MKFKDLYENACREVVESVASYWQGDDPTRQDDPYLNDFKRIIRETFCPDDCYPVIQSMFPWEASTASQQLPGLPGISRMHINSHAGRLLNRVNPFA